METKNLIRTQIEIIHNSEITEEIFNNYLSSDLNKTILKRRSYMLIDGKLEQAADTKELYINLENATRLRIGIVEDLDYKNITVLIDQEIYNLYDFSNNKYRAAYSGAVQRNADGSVEKLNSIFIFNIKSI